MALAALLVGSSVAAAAAPEQEAWVEVVNPPFTLFVQVAQERDRIAGEVLARDLVSLNEVLRGFMGDLAVVSNKPTYVYVFRNSDYFKAVRGRVKGDSAGVVGFFLNTDFAHYVAIDGDPRRDARRVIFHEYIHHFVADHLPGVPLWFNEGLAEYYSTYAEVDPPAASEGAATALLGSPPPSLRRWLERYPLESLDGILSAGRDSPYYSSSDHRGAFYSQSWLLVHYLLNGSSVSDDALGRPRESGDRGAQLIDYLGRLVAGESEADAFSSAFEGSTYRTLERELEAYLLLPELPVLEVPLTPEYGFRSRSSVSVGGRSTRSLGPGEVRSRLGDLWLQLPGPDADEIAQQLFEEALEANTSDALAWRGLGRLALQTRAETTAKQHLETAYRLQPGEPYTAFLRGRMMLARAADARRGLRGDAPSSSLAQVSDLARQAADFFQYSADRAPYAIGAWTGVARAAWVALEAPDEGAFRAVRRARELEPLSPHHLALEGLLHGRDERLDRALVLINGALRVMDEGVAQSVSGQLQADQRERLQRLQVAGNLDTVVNLLRRWAPLWEEAGDWELASNMGQEADRLAARLTLRRAVEWAQEGRGDEAEAALQDLIWNAEEALIRDEAQRLLDALRARP